MLDNIRKLIKEKLRSWWDSFLKSDILDDEIETDFSLLEMVEKAKEEWLDAKKFFEEVNDPLLVDHAIYRLESAEKKYMYLLKIANEEQVKNNRIAIF